MLGGTFFYASSFSFKSLISRAQKSEIKVRMNTVTAKIIISFIVGLTIVSIMSAAIKSSNPSKMYEPTFARISCLFAHFVFVLVFAHSVKTNCPQESRTPQTITRTEKNSIIRTI